VTTVKQQHGIFSPVPGLDQAAFLPRHLRSGSRKFLSHRDEGALHLLGYACYSTLFLCGRLSIQALTEVKALLGDSEQREESAHKDQQSNCNGDL
jgi:hypothetical protein